jgi:OOP family OmpA-OmpF porin
VIEVTPAPISLTLAPPAATPEKIADTTGDFPYLTPLPGSKFHSGAKDPSPFWVLPKGASVKEIVAPASLIRRYRLDGLSNVLFLTVYHNALTNAGWEIVDERNGADAAMTAHYSKNGRNIWAALHNNIDGFDLSVADAGGVSSLTTSLTKSCHVALYGVLFDFNKSTLQPASDAVLQQVAGLLTADKALKLEVQGHTDNVGNDAYNQTLSEARAKAVMAWLAQHGVAGDRLTAKGYGKTMPVADNGNDEGRAKNRRVEIADPKCSAKGK